MSIWSSQLGHSANLSSAIRALRLEPRRLLIESTRSGVSRGETNPHVDCLLLEKKYLSRISLGLLFSFNFSHLSARSALVARLSVLFHLFANTHASELAILHPLVLAYLKGRVPNTMIRPTSRMHSGAETPGSRLRVAVVGGGLCGLTLGVVLSRSGQVDVQMFESAVSGNYPKALRK